MTAVGRRFARCGLSGRGARLTGLLLGVSVMASACSTQPPPQVTVADLVRDPARFDGQRLRVVGWLSGCSGYDCMLYDRKADESRPSFDHFLSIGGSERFDAMAPAFRGRKVVLTATFDATCRSGHVFCTDRADELVVDPEPTIIAAKDS